MADKEASLPTAKGDDMHLPPAYSSEPVAPSLSHSAPSPNAVAPIAQPGVVNTFNGTPQMVASYRIAVAPDGQPLPPIKIVVASSVMNGSRPRDPNMCPIDDEPHEEDLNRRWLMCCLGVVWYIHNKKCVKCGLDML